MTTSVDQIHSLYKERQKLQEPALAVMRSVAELANGDVHVVHPELDVNEKATVVNLFPGGLDALATRAASVQPDQVWPSLRPGVQLRDDLAWQRRQAGLAWWDMNTIGIADRLRYRHYFGWGSTPVTVLPTASSPSDKRDIPHWRARSPLTAYPAPCEDKTDMEPTDAIFASRRPRAWLDARYGNAMARLDTGPRDQRRPDDMFNVLEYIDCEEIVLCCAGRSSSREGGLWTPGGYVQAAACVELERVPNKAGIPLSVFPGRITLDRMQGALDQMVPAYHRAAKLDSLNLLAIARGIFQDQWVVGHPGDPQSPEIITDADGMMGIIGEVAHGQVITLGNPTAAAQAADMAIDRLERSQRLVAGLPAELGGESGSNIRTARRGEQVLGSAIDMPIQEAQELFAASKVIELRMAVAVAKGWFGSKQTSFYVPRDGKVDKPDYAPNDTFETDQCFVKFSMPGTDANSLVIALGQRVNMGTMSLQTARETDPVIEDPVQERDRVEIEGLVRALLASLEQGAQQGTVGPDQIAAIAKAKYGTHEQLFDVVLKVHEEMQAKQAATAQAPAGDASQQPGLGGGPATPPAPPGPFNGPPSSSALASILGNLRGPANQGSAEKAPAA